MSIRDNTPEWSVLATKYAGVSNVITNSTNIVPFKLGIGAHDYIKLLLHTL